MKIGSLCTGYGGLDLAVEEHFAAETIWCAEFDKFASQVVEQRFGVPNFGDITKIDWHQVEPVDIITAGYPCQPFSQAGSRKGTNDHRHIWPHIAEAISIIRPRLVVLENVRGHLSLGFDAVLADLAQIGYDAEWRIVRASDTGAPHQRARLYIIAYPNGTRQQISAARKQPSQQELTSNGNFGTTPYADSDACQESRRTNPRLFGQAGQIINGSNRKINWSCSSIYEQEIPDTLDQGKLNAKFVEYMMGLPSGWVTETGLSRTQQLKMLGNGVVPQQAKLALELMTNVAAA